MQNEGKYILVETYDDILSDDEGALEDTLAEVQDYHGIMH